MNKKYSFDDLKLLLRYTAVGMVTRGHNEHEIEEGVTKQCSGRSGAPDKSIAWGDGKDRTFRLLDHIKKHTGPNHKKPKP